ncbi:sepiapterin reductase-like protein [Cricetulus griseus]|uniref:Sepiapterin reductase-like protein n=1 Tax=Cricetulus griseus TaxID=10029 RepID=A0A061HYX5_CRIGR|nr:sepiapterin reductase-like protein [Cricetulus griseus]
MGGLTQLEEKIPREVQRIRGEQEEGGEGTWIGTLVDISKAFLNMNEPGEVNNYWALNLTSMLFLIYSTPNAFRESPGFSKTVEQAASFKDAKPLGEAGAAGRRALETLWRLGHGVQGNHETAFQGMLRKMDIKNEDDVKSFS